MRSKAKTWYCAVLERETGKILTTKKVRVKDYEEAKYKVGEMLGNAEYYYWDTIPFETKEELLQYIQRMKQPELL